MSHASSLSTVLAASRSFDGLGGENTPLVIPIQPDALLQSVARHTHYMPSHWRGRGHARAVYDEFRALYQYKFATLLVEVLGALTAPLVMLTVLPQRAGAILAFLRTFTVYVEGVGHVWTALTPTLTLTLALTRLRRGSGPRMTLHDPP